LGSAYSTAAERLSVAAAAAASPVTCTTCAPFAAIVPTRRTTAARSATAERDAALAPALYLTITESVAACAAAAGTSKSRTTPTVARTALNIGSASRLIDDPPPRQIPLPAPAQSQR
jgi:hypothetical protein